MLSLVISKPQIINSRNDFDHYNQMLGQKWRDRMLIIITFFINLVGLLLLLVFWHAFLSRKRNLTSIFDFNLKPINTVNQINYLNHFFFFMISFFRNTFFSFVLFVLLWITDTHEHIQLQ